MAKNTKQIYRLHDVTYTYNPMIVVLVGWFGWLVGWLVGWLDDVVVVAAATVDGNLCDLCSETNEHCNEHVNQLNFAAVKFRRLPNFLYFAHFNFAYWYLTIFPDRNIASQKCL